MTCRELSPRLAQSALQTEVTVADHQWSGRFAACADITYEATMMLRVCLHGGVLLEIFATIVYVTRGQASDVTVPVGGVAAMPMAGTAPQAEELQVLKQGELVLKLRGRDITFGDRYKDRIRMTGDFPGGGAFSFNISSVRLQDAGVYKCANGSADNIIPNCGVSLRVVAPPSQARIVNLGVPTLGRELNLRCDSSSSSIPPGSISSYDWFRNGSSVDATAQLLKLNTVSRGDKGSMFECQAKEGTLSGPRSPIFLLDPDYGPYSITLNPSSAEYTVGPFNNSLPPVRCQPGPCKPVCGAVWSSRGGGADLRLQNLLREDSGVYTCNVSNSVGSLTAAVRVTVQYGPHSPNFTINGQTAGLVRVLESKTLEFVCAANALPPPSYRFLHEGEEVPLRAESQASSSGILRTTATCQRSGMQSCQAVNVYGLSQSSPLHLVVDCKPRPAEGQASGKQVKVSLGEAVELLVRLLAYPQPNITWHRVSQSKSQDAVEGHNDYSVGSTTTTVLRLEKVTAADLGHYRVTAVNQHGSDNVDIFLDEQTEDRLGLGIGVGVAVSISFILLVLVICVLVNFRRTGRLWSRASSDSRTQVKMSVSSNDNAVQRQESGERRHEYVREESVDSSRFRGENLYENAEMLAETESVCVERVESSAGVLDLTETLAETESVCVERVESSAGVLDLTETASPSLNGDVQMTSSSGHYEALQASSRDTTQEAYEKLKTSDNIYANS